MADRVAELDAEPGHLAARPHNADAVDPGKRGTLTIRDRAVQRIAEAAANSVPGVVPAAQSSSSLNTALGRAYPRIDCEVAGDRVRAQVDIVGLWPVPAPQLGVQVRQVVTDQLQALAGLRVDAVDVTIAKVVRVAEVPRRRVR